MHKARLVPGRSPSPHPFRQRVQSRMVFFAILPFVVLSTVLYALFAKTVREQIETDLRIEIDRVAESVDRVVSRHMRISTSVLNRIIMGSGRVFTDGYYALDGDYAQAIRRLNIELDFFNGELDMPIADTRGFTLFVENYAGYKGKYIESIQDFPAPDLIEEITQTRTDEFLWEKALRSDERGYKYRVFYRNFSASSRRSIFVQMTVPYEEIEDLIVGAGLVESVSVAHVDSHGDPVFVAGNYPSGGRGSRSNSRTIIIRSRRLADGSTLLLEVPFSHIRSVSLGALLPTILVTIVAISLIVATTIATSRRFVAGLDDFMDYLSNDDRFIQIDTVDVDPGSDEVSFIKHRVVGLVERINEMNQQFADAKNRNHEIELELLQSRINPHLLYNSLSSLKWDALRNGNRQSVSLITSMINYYRAALGTEETFVEVARELNLVAQYVNVINLSRRTHHSLRVEVSDHIRHLLVLKHILQPIVENCVVHGLAGRERFGEVTVSAFLNGDDLFFVVRDNGRGMSEERIAEICRLAYKTERGGYGIRNTIQRLKLHYGEQYGLWIRSVQNEYTEVTVAVRFVEGSSVPGTP